MSNKIIRDTADSRLERLTLSSLTDFQGDLKSLSEDSFNRLSKSIINKGFFVPLAVWTEKKTKIKRILDGHQRVRVLTKLAEEGWVIPELPVLNVEAKDEQEAKDKLLLLVSQFGKVEKQGLYEYLNIAGLDEKTVLTDYDLPEVDGMKFLDEFYNDLSADPLAGDPEPVTEGEEPLENGVHEGMPEGAPVSGVKMLQLFFNEETHLEAMNMIAKLQIDYDKNNATDVVFEALRREFSRRQG